jgi:hypothetical protein
MLGSPPTRQVRGEFDSQDYPERKRRFTGRVWRSGDRYEGGYDSAVNLRVEVRDGVFGVTPENSREEMAGTTRLELATSAVTGQRDQTLQQRRGCQNTCKPYKKSAFVGWVVGWKFAASGSCPPQNALL